ncbi:MAG: hypothetical protein CL811_04680 [Colwelliaceae bacterium]|nr:hypothetical protein [Colwelliaceae bacterium]
MAIKNKKTNENIDFKKNFSLYLKLAKNYKFWFLLIIFMALLIEGARLAEKYLFKLVVDRSTEFIAGSIIAEALISIFIIISVVFLTLVLIKTITRFFQNRLINRLDGFMMLDIKRRFFNHIVHLDHNFHTTHKTGSLIARMHRGARAVEAVNDFIVYNVAPLLLQLTLLSTALLYFDVGSAIVVVLTAIIFVAFGVYISTKQQQPQYFANKAEDHEKANIADVFTNIDSIKYFGKERTIKKRFSKLALDTNDKMVRFWDYGAYFGSGQSLVVGLGTFFVILFPILRLLEGDLSIGTLAFIYTGYFNLMGSLYGFVHGIRRFYVAMGDVDSLFEYDKIRNGIEDSPTAKKLAIKKGQIEFENVEFSYNDKNNKAVHDLSLKIKPNEKVALVGHSGCGKTTLVKLLYRFYDVSKGSIKIDGKNIKNFKQESLRSELSIVPQEAILFDDTIYNNIAFSNPSAAKEQVHKAIKFAQLDKLIEELPKKEKTIVGERGVKLSGGEKQRVSIARAILADRKVLVLDEATSALDSETEFEIQKDLAKLMRGRTSIIIAHRLSTIMNADKIVVLDKGKIVQVGKHRELIAKPGQYKKLWKLQKGGYLKE